MKKNVEIQKNFIWFRRDLRINDNKALFAACQNPDAQVIALYTETSLQWQKHDVAPRQIAFVHAHLIELAKALAKLGIPFVYQTCDTYQNAAQWIAKTCLQEQATELFFNNEYELNERRRDDQIVELLNGKVLIHAFDDSLLVPPNMIHNLQGEMYKVFTPFRKTVLKDLARRDNHCLPKPQPRKISGGVLNSPTILFEHQHYVPEQDYPIGEQKAIERLRLFCQYKVTNYAVERDIPSLNSTSNLSPYLAIGVLSVRQCLNRLLTHHPDAMQKENEGPFIWLSELIWREFYHHLMFAFPHLCRYKPFIAWTDQITWNTREEDFLAWKEGKTGYPIVDAAMRQLKQTGWMHNRLRMICASFLVKDLLIDWRKGEQYFMNQLLDGCFAANNGGWQWSASTGTDASPWFRIFNPTTQGQKFDQNGIFIRSWLPELNNVPDTQIHTPHEWAMLNHIKLDYPCPIVDHNIARKKTLEAFKKAQTQT